MTKVSATIDFSELFQKLDLIEQRMSKIEEVLIYRKAKEEAARKPIPQKAAMQELGVCFQTLKNLCLRFRVKPVVRCGRIFYRPEDINRIIFGKY